MSIFLKNILSLCTLCLLANHAQAVVDDWWSKCKSGQADCEFSAFVDIAPIYRPSKEETLFVAYIKNVFAKARNEIWSEDPRFSLFEDATGSLLIQVPATGRFTKLSSPPIAIQAHMDMVLAKKGAKPGEDLRPYFKGKLEFEEVQGWFQSKDNDKSIGADNSTGVAIALRYLIDRNREHPALEIIFTTQEEVGLVGAANFSFPLAASKLISLDNMSSSLVTVGCQGASLDLIKGEVARVHPVATAKFYGVVVSNLTGGHSGAMIHLPRANAIKVLANSLKKIATTKPDLMLGEFQSGNTNVLNVIPSAASSIFATSLPIDVEEIKAIVFREITAFSDEDPKTFQVEVKEMLVGDLHVLPAATSLNLLDQLIKMPHGVLSKESGFPNNVKTSTNFATISWLSGNEPLGNIFFGFMGRSFDPAELGMVTLQSLETLTSQWSDLRNSAHKNVATIDPWMAPKNSQLLSSALKDPQFKGTFIVPAYVEATVFAKKYPSMDIIGIGPDVEGFHTPKERVRIASLAEISAALARLLAQ
jgi:dipeptidase D